MVQIAAVSHFEDANVLVNALRKRGYAVTARRMPDGLIHVRIGPFATHEEASRVCTRLLETGTTRWCSRRGSPQTRIHSGRPEAMAARTASDSSSRVA